MVPGHEPAHVESIAHGRGERIDLSRVGFDDPEVYEALANAAIASKDGASCPNAFELGRAGAFLSSIRDRAALRPSELVGLDDVGMAQPGDGAGFMGESAEAGGMGGVGLAQGNEMS